MSPDYDGQGGDMADGPIRLKTAVGKLVCLFFFFMTLEPRVE